MSNGGSGCLVPIAGVLCGVVALSWIMQKNHESDQERVNKLPEVPAAAAQILQATTCDATNYRTEWARVVYQGSDHKILCLSRDDAREQAEAARIAEMPTISDDKDRMLLTAAMCNAANGNAPVVVTYQGAPHKLECPAIAAP